MGEPWTMIVLEAVRPIVDIFGAVSLSVAVSVETAAFCALRVWPHIYTSAPKPTAPNVLMFVMFALLRILRVLKTLEVAVR